MENLVQVHLVLHDLYNRYTQIKMGLLFDEYYIKLTFYEQEQYRQMIHNLLEPGPQQRNMAPSTLGWPGNERYVQ